MGILPQNQNGMEMKQKHSSFTDITLLLTASLSALAHFQQFQLYLSSTNSAQSALGPPLVWPDTHELLGLIIRPSAELQTL